MSFRNTYKKHQKHNDANDLGARGTNHGAMTQEAVANLLEFCAVKTEEAREF